MGYIKIFAQRRQRSSNHKSLTVSEELIKRVVKGKKNTLEDYMIFYFIFEARYSNTDPAKAALVLYICTKIS